MNVIIVYERKNRELESAILLKLKLEHLGCDCEIAQFYEVRKFYLFCRKRYDIIIVPHLYDDEEVYRTVARYGQTSHIINLQYEQVLSKKWEELGHHNPKGMALKYLHVCWGKKTQKRLIDAGVPNTNILLTGAIQLDLLDGTRETFGKVRKRFSNLFYLPQNKKWKLFLSSFTYADISDEKLRQNEKIANTKLASFKDIHTKSRDVLLTWFNSVMNEDKESIFIYRPHPDEADLSKVQTLEKKYNNFFIVNYSSAKEWIQASDLILSWYSTTIIESHFLDKPYAILRPLELPDDFDSVLLKKGHFIENFDDFKNEVYFNDEFIGKALLDSDVDEYYGGVDRKAADKLCKAILNKDLQINPVVNVPVFNYIKLLSLIAIKFFYVLEKKTGVKVIFNKFLKSLFSDFDNQIASCEEIDQICLLVKSRCKSRSENV